MQEYLEGAEPQLTFAISYCCDSVEAVKGVEN
jgi:hypothetical protein